MSRVCYGVRPILSLALLILQSEHVLSQQIAGATIEAGNVEFDQLEEAIVTSLGDEERQLLLDRFLELANSETSFPEFAAVSERLVSILPEEEADQVSYVLSVAQERYLDIDTARMTLETRQLNGGGPDTHWGFLLRYRTALLASKQQDYEVAANIFESLYALGDEVIPEVQQGRLRRQLTDTYKQLNRWEDTIRLGEEARLFTSADDERILGVLYHLGAAYSAMGEYDAAAMVISDLAERVNHFYPDQSSRRRGVALAYAGVEEWAIRAQELAVAHADAENGPLRSALRDSIDHILEDSGAGDMRNTSSSSKTASSESSQRILDLPSAATGPLPKGTEAAVWSESPSDGERFSSFAVWLVSFFLAIVLSVAGTIFFYRRSPER